VKIAITGSHGLIGSALMAGLPSQGHQVIRIVRTDAGPDDIEWVPIAGRIDSSALEGTDAVINLAGAGVGDHRWSEPYKAEILRSRIDGTATLSNALAHLARPPRVLLNGSAIGYYGLRGTEVLTETSGPGSGFLADLCLQWEEATAPARDAGLRVVRVRSGVVLSAAGGALKKQLAPFKLGLGARLGRGVHYLSWITRRDFVRAVDFLLRDDSIAGPVNVTSPGAVSNAEFTTSLGLALHRPAKLMVPEVVLRAAVGREMTSEFFLASQRVVPRRLLDAGFTFSDDSIDKALAVAMADRDLTLQSSASAS
jgi:uncharacterized protein (TIGR01777 family)